jgi:KDO2-lipid IV(A) lauroyltransferase
MQHEWHMINKIAYDVALMNQAIEQLVKTKPEQYLWNYKRFKGIICYYLRSVR